jgi:hypothetical protein
MVSAAKTEGRAMKLSGQLAAAAVGVGLGAVATMFYLGQPRPAAAGSNDRFQDYAIATGPVSLNPRQQTDGVWLLDYRSGKLLGTVIDKAQGKIVGWAEVDLVGEFELAPKQDVHFMMVTGWITQGQAALYVAETTTGKFGVYTMGPGANGSGVVIRRHDLTSFRKAAEPAQPGPIGPASPPATGPGG